MTGGGMKKRERKRRRSEFPHVLVTLVVNYGSFRPSGLKNATIKEVNSYVRVSIDLRGRS